ncbi:MAG: GNAT family N-acetyltransferase [Egibacteraceae bacterium]
MFVVEQQCLAPELDDRDGEPGTWHCWIEEGGGVVAYLRILAEPDGSRIGRVVTAPGARGSGYASRLMWHALGLATPPVVVHAQVTLEGWYAGFGFARVGPEFTEGRIPHVRMRYHSQRRHAFDVER